nr:hypothetical protein [Tanacetum cinerariifolium]
MVGTAVTVPRLNASNLPGNADTIQLENAVSTISQEYLLEFTSEYGIPEGLHPELPGLEETIMDFPKGKVDMDLFNLISSLNPTKVKTETRPRAAHEVPLLTVTASHVIDMEDVAVALESSGTPFTIEKSPLDFANKDQPQIITEGVALETGLEKEVAAMRPPVNKRRRKRGNNEVEANVPPKVLRRDYDAFRPAQSTHGEKSLASMSSKGTATEILTEDVATTEYLSIGVGRDERMPPGRPRCVPRHSGSHYATKAKNIKTLLEAEVDMKKSTEVKNAKLANELDSLRIKAVFEEFKKYEDDKVEQRYVEMDARLDKLSVEFDEKLYPHMLTAIAGRRWVIGHDLRISEDLKCGIEHGKVGRDLADIKAYDPESNNKLVKALQDLKDLKYPIIDQLEKLKDTPIKRIMASLYLESDTGEDAPQWIQEMMLEDAIAANISRGKKKNKCRVVCRTHGIGFAHHARSDGIHVSMPTIPQGLAILLADAATQTEAADQEEPHPRLQQSMSSSPVYDLYWK